ncbi:uncharacterized protein [Glycine max]|uniref:uncharacterized protein isoform X2 n=1 Tax=Glycine max TaxID=3847 RepID=UPI001B354A20|nr:uncharacterized protein LOC100794813 isoform X2 [Glycine max]
MQLAFSDAVYLVDAIEGGEELSIACIILSVWHQVEQRSGYPGINEALGLNPELGLGLNPELSLDLNPELGLGLNPELSLDLKRADYFILQN